MLTKENKQIDGQMDKRLEIIHKYQNIEYIIEYTIRIFW